MVKLKMGVIGIGFAWDRLHYPALKELGDKYEIVAVCNKTIYKAQGFAKGINLPADSVYDDYKKLLERTDLDVVDLLVPISENYEIAKDVIAAGKNLIAEKPFASYIKAAKDLIALKNEKNVKIMVAENYRYDDGNNIIKDIICNGQIGEVVYFILNIGADFEKNMKKDEFAAKEWRQYPAFSGGIFLDGGIHDIALLRFLFGDIESLYAYGRPQEEPYCPYIAINSLLKFKNNVAGQYSYFAQGSELQKPPIGFRIFGTLGQIYVESKESGVVNINYNNGTSEKKNFTPSKGYYNELLNFYNAITAGMEIVSTPEKELGDIEAVYKILESIQTNKVM